jgi:adenosylcobinamide-GDP ribazoletransferase
MSALSDLRAAVAFLTPLGLGPSGGAAAAPSPGTMAYFPAVGAALGCVVGWGWRLARRHWAPLPAAALAVAADAVLTGALHLDGLADAADGLLAHAPAQSRLEIMAEPRVGTFGTVALGLSLIARTSALASLAPSPVLLSAIYGASRAVMVVGSRALPYARDTGLATAFLPSSPGWDAPLVASLAGASAALALASVGRGRQGAVAVVTGWATGALVLGLARRRLGGFTGDVLGAAGTLCETAALVMAARAQGQRPMAQRRRTKGGPPCGLAPAGE